MVTLSAAFNDPILNPILLGLISEKELRLILEKTLSFLDFTGTPSSALKMDWRILRAIGEKTGLLPSGPTNMSSSFSSSSTEVPRSY